MAQAIETNFDQALEQDFLLEQLDGQAPAVATTLKNAENVYKSFLYLKKMYSKYPAKDTIKLMDTVSYPTDTLVIIPEEGNWITVNNYSGANAAITINGGKYILQPGEKESFPLISPDTTAVPTVSGDALLLSGDVSFVIKNKQEY